MTQKKRIGRPPQPIPSDKADSVIEWISQGKSLLSWSKLPGNPSAVAVYLWRDKDPEFASRLARAREIGYEVIEQQIHDIADSPLMGEEVETTGVGNRKTTKTKRGDMLGHRKLQIETRLKLLAIWNPAKYAERRMMEHSGKVSLEQLVAGDE